MPTAMPLMMVVAEPVSDWSAMRLTEEYEADDETRDNGQRVVDAAKEDLAQHERADRDDHGRDVGAHLQRGVGVGVVLAADKEGGDDGGRDAERRDNQRVEAQRQRRDYRADIALEQVRAHAGDVAHVVAHVVGDDGGVAGVVLGDAGLDLAHQVGADVGGLGIDAAAHAREQGDGRGAQREAEEDGVVLRQDIDETAAEQAETHHAHAHDRAAREGDRQRAVHAALLRRLRRADVGAGGDLHAEEAGQDREERAEDEADGRHPVDEEADQQQQRRDEDREDLVLGLQKGVRALGDGGCDLLHVGRAGAGLRDEGGFPRGEKQRAEREQRGDPDKHRHNHTHSQSRSKGACLPLIVYFNRFRRFLQGGQQRF